MNLIFGNDLHFLIDTCLLIAVIYLIFHLSQQYDISGITTRRAFLWTNYFLCFVLATLYLTRTGLDIRSLWYQVFDPEKLVAQIGSGLTIPIVDILDITFDAICLLISAEILGGALWIFMTRKQRNIPTSVRPFSSFVDHALISYTDRIHLAFAHRPSSIRTLGINPWRRDNL